MQKRVSNPAVAVAYVRASTLIQDNTAQVQREALQKYAAAHGLEIVEFVEELGVSGAAPLTQRPGLMKALALVKFHNAGVLLFADRSRIARDVLLAKLIEQAALTAGAVIRTADGVSGDDAHQKLIATILDAVAEYEKELIRGRIKAALDEKKKRGERTGGIPYGFKLDPNDPAGKALAPDPREQEIVTRIRAMRAAGTSQLGITEALEKAGTLNRSGKAVWHKTQIVRILKAS